MYHKCHDVLARWLFHKFSNCDRTAKIIMSFNQDFFCRKNVEDITSNLIDLLLIKQEINKIVLI